MNSEGLGITTLESVAVRSESVPGATWLSITTNSGGFLAALDSPSGLAGSSGEPVLCLLGSEAGSSWLAERFARSLFLSSPLTFLHHSSQS